MEGWVELKNRLHIQDIYATGLQSGRRELNPGPLAPHASALAGLRYAPIDGEIIAYSQGYGKPGIFASRFRPFSLELNAYLP
jgi:hypothetical protein